MATTDPAKRIPKSLGTEARIFGSYTLSDLGVGLLPAVLVVLITQVILPSSAHIGGFSIQSVTLPLAGVAVVFGALFVALTPSYVTSLDWVAIMLRYHRSPHQFDTEAARSYTHLERIYPDEGVIERTDGTYLGFVQVDPPSMALATPTEWRSMAESFQDFCNTVLEFPVQIYSTTTAFPVDEYLDGYRERLADADVKANPQLAALIEEYVAWYSDDLEQRQMTIRDHYVIVSVSPDEVQFERESLLDGLAKLPIIGLVVRLRYAMHRADRRVAMVRALDDRLRRVEVGLRALEGCHARRLSVEEAVTVIGEFWAGTSLEFDNDGQRIRTRPLVGRSR